MRNHKLTKTLLLTLGLGCSLSVSAREQMDAASKAGGSKPGNGNRITANCLASSSNSSLDINNVRAMVLNGGDMWWDLSSARYEVPKVNDPNAPKRHAIFSGAVWVGGKDGQNQLYTSTQTYRQGNPQQVGYWPGPLDNTGNITKDDCAAWNYHAKIDKAVIDKFRGDFSQNAFVTSDDLPKAIKDWPGKNNPYISGANNPSSMNFELAPFEDVDKDGNYNPMMGDYPTFQGDQGIWWVMNDAGNQKTPTSKKIGLEVQVLAFAFQTNDLINNMTFYKQILKNKGSIQLKDTYIGQWVDPDLGFYNDDFVGCDVARGLGICYNGDNDDEGPNGYGLNPPAVGVDFFQGPLADFFTTPDGIDNDKDGVIDEAGGEGDGVDNNRDGIIDEIGEKIIMSSFIYYNNDSDPTNGNPSNSKATDFYNYLQASWLDGKKITYGGDGKDQTKPVTKFMFPEETDPKGYGLGYVPAAPGSTPNQPVAPPSPFSFNEGWSEFNTDGNGKQNTPADRRFLQSAGPFTLNPGSVNELTIGVVWARANSGGAQGSLGLLKYADDKAQQLFDNDFKLPQGPKAPEAKLTELDQQLILSLDATKPFLNANDQLVTTENFIEVNNSFVYRFEGYKIYQLKDLTVSASELDNKDRARIVAQADVKNGITDIINYDFDADLNQTVPKLKVRGSDQGVFHTLNITTDLFATGSERLVNFKAYHYMVVAYAYNGDSANIDSKYLEGRSVSLVTGIPHKAQVENGGTILNSNYGSAAEITRIFGTGTGGHVLEISAQDEQDIVANGSKKELHYQPNHAPFVVKVYDPKKVKNGDFSVKLSSRLVYKKTSAAGTLQVLDTILSTGNYTAPAPFDATKFANTMTPIPQIPGKAIVKRITEEDRLVDGKTEKYVTLDLEMMNDHLGGTFVAYVDKYNRKIVLGQVETDFESHITEPRTFKDLNGHGFTATSFEFVLNDFWTVTNKANGETIRADRPISTVNEQLLPDFGIAIEFKHATNPQFQVRNNQTNAYLESSLTFTGTKWLTGIQSNVPVGSNVWLLPKSTQGAASKLTEMDPNYNYLNVVNGTWAPYNITVKGNGPAYEGLADIVGTAPGNRKLYTLQNVDIVMTSDRSKWTRVPVLQGETPGAGAFKLTKEFSDVPSLDVNYNPAAGEMSPYPKKKGVAKKPSLSMSWFPGYAIDLDRGIRLNMMFAEFGVDGVDPNDANQVALDKQGRNLIWEPTSASNGGKNFVYVMNTKYDRGEEAEYYLDSAKYNYGTLGGTILGLPSRYTTIVQNNVFEKVIWAGYPKLVNGTELLASDARVRLRVNRYFTSYNQVFESYNVRSNNAPKKYVVNSNPEYEFSTNNLVAQVEQKGVASDALGLIRVVPNPYYAYSSYQQGQLDKLVKITNLPVKCKISIYTVNGTLVKVFNKDDATKTYLDWNLKNENNLPIASGVYIVHVDAGNIGQKVVKFFGIMSPVDLDAF